MPPEEQQPLFKELAADLPDKHKAEFYRNLHEAGISPNDVELARLLRALQLYKAYYETIPSAVQNAAANIERLKKEIEELNSETRSSLEASAQLAGKVIEESEKVRKDLTQINKHIDEAMRQSAESLAARMAEHLSAGIEQKVLLPLQNRLIELAGSKQVFDEAIAQSNKATAALQTSTVEASRFHIRTYVFSGCLVACMLVGVGWFFLHRSYADRFDQKCAEMVLNAGKNRAVLKQLAKSHRILQLLQDPENADRKILYMKDAAGWQSPEKYGVIEFKE